MKKIISRVLVLIIAASLFVFSCDKNDLGKLREIELEKLDDFIKANYPDIIPKPSGLFYIETVTGTGDTIKSGDRVQMFYSTWTIDSLLIDETNGYAEGQRFEPFEFIVGSGDAIKGLEEAATYMQPGTKASLVIPSELAYGQNGSSGVAGFTTLLMEVEVYKVYPLEIPEGD